MRSIFEKNFYFGELYNIIYNMVIKNYILESTDGDSICFSGKS